MESINQNKKKLKTENRILRINQSNIISFSNSARNKLIFNTRSANTSRATSPKAFNNALVDNKKDTFEIPNKNINKKVELNSKLKFDPRRLKILSNQLISAKSTEKVKIINMKCNFLEEQNKVSAKYSISNLIRNKSEVNFMANCSIKGILKNNINKQTKIEEFKQSNQFIRSKNKKRSKSQEHSYLQIIDWPTNSNDCEEYSNIKFNIA